MSSATMNRTFNLSAGAATATESRNNYSKASTSAREQAFCRARLPISSVCDSHGQNLCNAASG